MSIEEVKELVRLEKEAEEKLRDAQKGAAALIEKAKTDAHNVIQEAEDPEQYDSIFNAKSMEIEERKKTVDMEVNENIKRIQEKAQKNLEKTVSLIIKLVLFEEL